MIIKKSIAIWDHVPTLEELQAVTDPDKDLTATTFDDNVDISVYLDFTGLRIFSNGKDRFRSEMKYILRGSEPELPMYKIPEEDEFLLI